MRISFVELILIVLILGGFTLIVGFLFFKLAGLHLEIVPQGKQLIIHQLGLFKRLAGPGPVLLRSMETVEQTIDVRNQPHRIPVGGLFLNGIPFSYTLEIWYRTALEELANGDVAQLARWVEFSEAERQQMARTKVFEAVSKSVAHMQENHKADGPEFFYNILPIVPGLSANVKMMNQAKARLADSLAAIGIQLDPKEDLIITGLTINDKVAAGLGRGQIVQLLRESFPSLSEDVLLEAMASIDKIKLPHSRITIQSDGETSVDIRTDEDGQAEARVRKNTGGGTARRTTAEPAADPVVEEQVAAEDWEVLKRVPGA